MGVYCHRGASSLPGAPRACFLASELPDVQGHSLCLFLPSEQGESLNACGMCDLWARFTHVWGTELPHAADGCDEAWAVKLVTASPWSQAR